MQPWAYQFYNSTAWKRCREAYKAAVHYQCENCGEPGEIVHHKTVLTPDNINDPEVTLNFRRLRLLCRRCHGMIHGNNVTMPGVTFDQEGNLVPVGSPPPSKEP